MKSEKLILVNVTPVRLISNSAASSPSTLPYRTSPAVSTWSDCGSRGIAFETV
jgi:hypothetical protein